MATLKSVRCSMGWVCERICAWDKNVGYLFQVFIAQKQEVVPFSHGQPGTGVLKPWSKYNCVKGGRNCWLQKVKVSTSWSSALFLQMVDTSIKKNKNDIYNIQCNKWYIHYNELIKSKTLVNSSPHSFTTDTMRRHPPLGYQWLRLVLVKSNHTNTVTRGFWTWSGLDYFNSIMSEELSYVIMREITFYWLPPLSYPHYSIVTLQHPSLQNTDK